MSVTVDQALTFGGLIKGRVVAGARNLGNIIDSVDIIETPCVPEWESQCNKCLNITTFYAIKEDLESQIKTVEMLARWKSSALVVQLSILGQLSHQVIERAEELGLPLVVIPETVTYIEIVTPLVGAILQEKTYLLQRSEDIHRKLTDICLSGGGFQAIITALANLVNRPAAIIDNWGNLIAFACFENSKLKILDRLKNNSMAIAVNDSQPIYQSNEGIWLMQLFPGQEYQSEGYIVVVDPTHDLDPLGLLAIEQASIIAALEMVKQHAILETERRLQHNFFGSLLGESSISSDMLLSQAHTLGWDLNDKQIIALINISGLEQTYSLSDSLRLKEFQYFKDHFLDIFTGIVRECDLQSIVVDQSENLILLLHCDKNQPAIQIRRELQIKAESIASKMKFQGYDIDTVIIFGGFHDKVQDLRKSYDEALMASKVSKRLSLKQPVIWYDDVILYILLDRIASQPEITGWLERTLGKLIDYDRVNKSDLVRTLEIFFDTNQIAQQAASSLFIHPKTLKYRLHRIEDILGIDPFSKDQQLSFYLATKLNHLINFVDNR
jgi:purine catabolism regulator